MTQKTGAVFLLIAGLILAIVSLFADSLGIGTKVGTFGWAQTAGTIVGVVAVVAALYLLARARAAESATAQPETQGAGEPIGPAPVAPDDLTAIEGIGPVIQGILRDAGIATFGALAATSAERLATILADADFRAPVDPATWPDQAALAAAGRWAELSELQQRLRGGRGE